MPIDVTCPGCEYTATAPDNFAGKRVKCRRCGASVQIPAMDGGLDLMSPDLADLPTIVTDEEPVPASLFRAARVPSAAPVLPAVDLGAEVVLLRRQLRSTRRWSAAAGLLLALMIGGEAWRAIPLLLIAYRSQRPVCPQGADSAARRRDYREGCSASAGLRLVFVEARPDSRRSTRCSDVPGVLARRSLSCRRQRPDTRCHRGDPALQWSVQSLGSGDGGGCYREDRYFMQFRRIGFLGRWQDVHHGWA